MFGAARRKAAPRSKLACARRAARGEPFHAESPHALRRMTIASAPDAALFCWSGRDGWRRSARVSRQLEERSRPCGEYGKAGLPILNSRSPEEVMAPQGRRPPNSRVTMDGGRHLSRNAVAPPSDVRVQEITAVVLRSGRGSHGSPLQRPHPRHLQQGGSPSSAQPGATRSMRPLAPLRRSNSPCFGEKEKTGTWRGTCTADLTC